MPRPFKYRKVCGPPFMSGFKPYGIESLKKDPLRLTFDEYESIRLLHYKCCSQDEAAEQMNISRPTFSRVYARAMKVIATALVEGTTIEITGGNYQFEQQWYKCKNCHKLIEGEEAVKGMHHCFAGFKSELVNLNIQS